jgi:hypothetical protein
VTTEQPQIPPGRGTVFSQLAEKILSQVASALSRYMYPVARLVPNRSVTLNQISCTASVITSNVQLTYPTDGYLVGIRATTEDGAAASASGLLLRVQVDGSEDLFSSGQGNGAGYVAFSQISGQNSQLGSYMICRPFWQASAWVVSFNNTTGSNLVADVTFDIVDTRNPRVAV